MSTPLPNRLYSLDVFRGITMFLLMAEAAQLYAGLTDYFPSGFAHSVVEQFHHHPWNGLRFWDLIQPFFMFIVGVAMPFSLRSRLKKGGSWSAAFRHILRRCIILFLLGTGLHCVYSGKIVFELWNVLTQLSFTIMITFLILEWNWKKQLGVAMGCLLLTELLYRLYDPTAPFIKDQNFGSWFDFIIMGKIDDGGGWVFINCLPTAAHTIGGAMVGQLLLSDRSGQEKLRFLLVAGFTTLLLGYGMDLLQLTPIIKRIATTSFVIVSGGWCLLTLAFLFWLIDLKGFSRWGKFFAIVGMNSIFIYIFGETIGVQWLGDFGHIFTYGLLAPLGISGTAISVFNSCFVLAMMWGLCYFLYRRNVFIKV